MRSVRQSDVGRSRKSNFGRGSLRNSLSKVECRSRDSLRDTLREGLREIRSSVGREKRRMSVESQSEGKSDVGRRDSQRDCLSKVECRPRQV